MLPTASTVSCIKHGVRLMQARRRPSITPLRCKPRLTAAGGLSNDEQYLLESLDDFFFDKPKYRQTLISYMFARREESAALLSVLCSCLQSLQASTSGQKIAIERLEELRANISFLSGTERFWRDQAERKQNRVDVRAALEAVDSTIGDSTRMKGSPTEVLAAYLSMPQNRTPRLRLADSTVAGQAGRPAKDISTDVLANKVSGVYSTLSKFIHDLMTPQQVKKTGRTLQIGGDVLTERDWRIVQNLLAHFDYPMEDKY